MTKVKVMYDKLVIAVGSINKYDRFIILLSNGIGLSALSFLQHVRYTWCEGELLLPEGDPRHGAYQRAHTGRTGDRKHSWVHVVYLFCLSVGDDLLMFLIVPIVVPSRLSNSHQTYPICMLLTVP